MLSFVSLLVAVLANDAQDTCPCLCFFMRAGSVLRRVLPAPCVQGKLVEPARASASATGQRWYKGGIGGAQRNVGLALRQISNLRI